MPASVSTRMMILAILPPVSPPTPCRRGPHKRIIRMSVIFILAPVSGYTVPGSIRFLQPLVSEHLGPRHFKTQDQVSVLRQIGHLLRSEPHGRMYLVARDRRAVLERETGEAVALALFEMPMAALLRDRHADAAFVSSEGVDREFQSLAPPDL